MLCALLVLIFSLALNSGVPVKRDLPEIGPVKPAYASVSAGDCDRWAAPPGRRALGRDSSMDDSQASRQGSSQRQPLRSVPALARSLRRGETGCLLPGHYRHSDPARLQRPRTALIGLGPGVRVDGAIWVTEGARGAAVRGLALTASDSNFFIPLKVQADRVLIAGNRIRGTRSTSCVLVGSTRRATAVRIERNWIHDCGSRGKLDHLVYLEDTRRAVVRGNVLDRNPGGWAVHMYADADASRIERNLIDGNYGGVIFAGDDDDTSDYNVVRWNVIGFSQPRWNIEGSWEAATGHGNVAYANCLYATRRRGTGGVDETGGFALGDNVIVPRQSGGRGGIDRYRLAGSMGCGRLVEPLPPAFAGR